eukprot:7324741-Prymnesium_polylepis.1
MIHRSRCGWVRYPGEGTCRQIGGWSTRARRRASHPSRCAEEGRVAASDLLASEHLPHDAGRAPVEVCGGRRAEQ